MRSNDRAAAYIPLMVNISFSLFFGEAALRELPVALAANRLASRCAKNGACPQNRELQQAVYET